MNRPIPLFQSLLRVSYMLKRSCSELPQGIKYTGFTYYPRENNFQDPPYEPSKLFFVKRIKPMTGRNSKEKKCLEHLNIDGKVKDNGHVAVVKNTPYVNSLLWKVKHLVEIKPLIVKGELPRDGDYSGTFLRQTGEFVISPKLKVSAKEIEASEKFLNNDNQLHRNYLREYLRKKWWTSISAYE